MRQTPNLLLKLPDSTDYVNIEDINENMQTIDTEIAKINDPDTGVGAKLTAHLEDDMPHKYTNSDNGKTYRYGFGIDAGGPYYIQQEVE